MNPLLTSTVILSAAKTSQDRHENHDITVKNSNDRFDVQRMQRRVVHLKIITLILGGIGVLTAVAAIILSLVGALIMPVFPVVTVAALVKVSLMSITGAIAYAIKRRSTKKKIQAHNANAKPIQNSAENATESSKNPETDNPTITTTPTPTSGGGAVIQPTHEPASTESVTNQFKQLQLENLRQTLTTQLCIQEQEFNCLNEKTKIKTAPNNIQKNSKNSRIVNFSLAFQKMRYEHAIIAQHFANRKKRLLELQEQWQQTFGVSEQAVNIPETENASNVYKELKTQSDQIEKWLQQARANQGWFSSSAKKQQLQDLKNAQKAYAEKLSNLKPALDSESQRRTITNKLQQLHAIKTQIEASKQKLDELARIAPEQPESDKQMITRLRNHAIQLDTMLERIPLQIQKLQSALPEIDEITVIRMSNRESASLDRFLKISSDREKQIQKWLMQRHTNEKKITEPIKAWGGMQRDTFDRLQKAQAMIFPQSSK
ncbi:MAG: hypothetical protein K2L13_03880 [Opitutales bacterium]|nr:hypothetical protein [Opitutales bacterium]